MARTAKSVGPPRSKYLPRNIHIRTIVTRMIAMASSLPPNLGRLATSRLTTWLGFMSGTLNLGLQRRYMYRPTTKAITGTKGGPRFIQEVTEIAEAVFW